MEDQESVDQTTPTEPEINEAAAPVAESAPESTPASEAAAEPTAEIPTSPAPATDTAPEAAAPAAAPTMEVVADAAALAEFAERASTHRLPPAEEEKAARLVQAGLLAGKEEQQNVVNVLPKLGWAIAVKGVTAAWPSLKATARNAFLKMLTADESEAGRRIRLSIARGLFKVPDVATATKLIVGLCKDLRDKETGQLGSRDAQHFANVVIGKGKPWVAQIPLEELKPADVALLVHCAVIAAFSIGGPPVTPLGVLKWAEAAGQLGQLHEAALDAVIKGVSRWSPKWADALRKEVPSLPEPVLAVLKPAAPEPEPAAPREQKPQQQQRRDRRSRDNGLPAELQAELPPEPNAPDAEPTEGSPAAAPFEPAAQVANEDLDDDDDEDEEEDDEAEDGLPAELKEGRSSRSTYPAPSGDQPPAPPKERPVYISKTVPPRGDQQRPGSPAPQQPQPQRDPRGPAPRSAQFNASDALRQLEAHIGWLKNELQTADKKLRAREDDRRQKRLKPEVPVIEGEPTPEELARLNLQLESRIVELQARVNDLTADAEARATSAGAFVDGPAPAPEAQLRALLGLKLKDHYADFLALEQLDRDLVIPQHYRTVLADVFEILKAESVPLTIEG